jgi:hypothetical protein
VYSALAAAILALHLLFILWVVFGATVTRRRPVLRWLHLGSVIWGMLIEILPWNCPLTWTENWLEAGAGVTPYQGGFLLHYLDALVFRMSRLVCSSALVSPSVSSIWESMPCVSTGGGSLGGRTPERKKHDHGHFEIQALLGKDKDEWIKFDVVQQTAITKHGCQERW